MRDFKQQYGPVALVTGASSGIGKSFAEALAARGLDLLLVARRLDRLDALAAALRAQHGVRVDVLQVDLADQSAAQRVLDASAALDIGLLVNNAGTGGKGPFEQCSAAELVETLTVNCTTPTLLAHGFVPRLKRRGRGGLLFTSSVEALIGCPYSANYSSSKALVNSLGEALWGELTPEGIDVLTVCPGATATDRLQGVDPATLRNAMSPDDVARLALDNLCNGPVYVPSEHYRKLFEQLASMPRRTALSTMARSMKQVR